MKRDAAIKKVSKIAANLRSVSGLIGTPGTQRDAIRVKRAWVFGSTVKGKNDPNDVDVLLEFSGVGRVYSTNKRKKWHERNIGSRLYGARLNKGFFRSTGCYISASSEKDAFKFIKGGMTKISLHDYESHKDIGDISQTMVLIYPRDDFSAKLTELK